MKKLILTALICLCSTQSWALTNSSPALDTKWDSVVQIVSDAPDADGEDIPGYCNATLIAKNTLVTAAHCIKLLYLSGKNDLRVQVGQYKHVTRPDGRVVRVGYVTKQEATIDVQIEINESLKRELQRKKFKTQISPQDDFALLHWNEQDEKALKLFFEVTPSKVVSKKEHQVIFKNVSAYQFDLVSINFMSEMSTDTKRSARITTLAAKNGHLAASKSSSRVQEGDSGAPLFVSTSTGEKVFAVVKGRASTIFSNWDVFSNVHDNFCEVSKRIPNDLYSKNCQ